MTLIYDLPSAGSALPDRDNDIIKLVDVDYPSPGGKEYKITLNDLGPTLYMADPIVASILTTGLIQSLTALRGFWPGSGQLDNDGANRFLTDLSGNGKHLIHNNNPRHAFAASPPPYVSYIDFNGSTEWYSDPDEAHWDIDGLEAETDVGAQGLTIGTWVKHDTTAAAYEFILSKWSVSTQLSYYLARNDSGYPEFGISNTGTTNVPATGDTVIPASTWSLLVGRFDPSNAVDLFHNGIWKQNTTSIPASIFVSTADLFMGARDDDSTPGLFKLDGSVCLAFICAAKIPDATIEKLWTIGRHAFGV